MYPYSIPYTMEGFGLSCALQWNPIEKRWWVRWDKSELKMGEDERFLLLEYFELEEWASEFPLDRIKWMSPRHLLASRRAYEAREPSLARLDLDLAPFLAG